MYSNDSSFQQARKRLFSSLFFMNNLPYKNYGNIKNKPTPVFLKEDWKARFYNIPYPIDEENTIIVFEDGSYDYYANLPNDKKFYFEVKDNQYNLFLGRKYRKVVE